MLAATIMVAVMSVFTACNKDKDDDGSSNNSSGTGIVGTWYGFDVDYPNSKSTITFKSDGTGTWDESDGVKNPFTYEEESKSTGKMCVLFDEKIEDIIYYEIIDGTLYLYNEENGKRELSYELTKQ